MDTRSTRGFVSLWVGLGKLLLQQHHTGGVVARYRLRLTVTCEYEVEDTDYIEDGIVEYLPDSNTVLDIERDFLDEDIQYALDLIENDREKRKIKLERVD